MGETYVILGIKIMRLSNRILLSKPHYVEKVLTQRVDMLKCSPMSTPMDCNKIF